MALFLRKFNHVSSPPVSLRIYFFLGFVPPSLHMYLSLVFFFSFFSFLPLIYRVFIFVIVSYFFKSIPPHTYKYDTFVSYYTRGETKLI